MTAFPATSVAIQKATDAHDTLVKPKSTGTPGSTFLGADQEPATKNAALPDRSTVTQKPAAGQEIDDRPVPAVIPWGPDQSGRDHRKELPEEDQPRHRRVQSSRF